MSNYEEDGSELDIVKIDEAKINNNLQQNSLNN